MSTWGKVCLVLTLLLLLMTVAPIPSPWGGWAPTLLVIHNQWSVKLRDAKEKNLKDVATYHDAEMELRDAAAELARVQMGWDRVWEFRNGEGNLAASRSARTASWPCPALAIKLDTRNSNPTTL